MAKREQITWITITTAARQTGLSTRTIRRYVRQGLINERLTEEDLAEVRRIRRLTNLGVNLAGVEVILRMRQRLEELHVEVARLERLLESLD